MLSERGRRFSTSVLSGSSSAPKGLPRSEGECGRDDNKERGRETKCGLHSKEVGNQTQKQRTQYVARIR